MQEEFSEGLMETIAYRLAIYLFKRSINGNLESWKA